MNREEKKLYLNSYLELEREIDILAEKYHFWEETIKSVPITHLELSGIHGSSHKDKVIEHLDICNTIALKIEEANQKLDEILMVIDRVESPEQRTALKYRYVNGKYVYEIAKLMNYSIDGMYKLLRRAVDSVEIGQ